MNKRDKLTPGNIKTIGVPAALHEKLAQEAKREHVAIFEVIADALEARVKLAAVLAITGDDHANN